MQETPRLVASDIDGTLLRDDRTLSPRTAAVLARIAAAGTPVVLVTGRPIRWLQMVYEQLAEPLPAICANGAVVYDPVTDQVLRADPLAPELLAEVARRLRAEVPGVSLAVEIVDSRQMRHEAHYPLRWDADLDAIRAVESPEELLAAPAVKLLARAGEQDPDVFVRVVAGALDAICHIEPYATQCVQGRPGSKVLSDGIDLYGPGYSDCVLAARIPLLESNPEAVTAMIKALMEAQASAEADMEAALASTVGTYYKTTLEAARDAASKQPIVVDQRNQTQFIIDRGNSMKELGYVRAVPDEKAFDWSFLDAAIAQNADLYASLKRKSA